MKDKYVEMNKLFDMLPRPRQVENEDDAYNEGYNDALMEIAGILHNADQPITVKHFGDPCECGCTDFILRTVYHDHGYMLDEVYECTKCHALYRKSLKVVQGEIAISFDRYFIG